MKKVIFIVAPPHSGTTILYKMLGKHPGITWFSQYSMRGGEIPDRFRLPLYRQIDNFLRACFDYSWDKSNKNRSKVIPRPSEPHKIWDHLLPDKKEFFTEKDTDAIKNEKAKQLISKECQVHDKDYLVTKLPRLSRAVGLLKEVFPDAYFIHIIRDGKAVALSNRHKFARHTDSQIQALKDSAKHWQGVVRYVENNLADEDRSKTIRYENFCGKVPHTLKDIISDVGISPDGFDFSGIPGQLTVTNQEHFESVSSKEKQLLNGILRETLTKYDYDTFTLE
jgi:hypothetical protein